MLGQRSEIYQVGEQEEVDGHLQHQRQKRAEGKDGTSGSLPPKRVGRLEWEVAERVSKQPARVPMRSQKEAGGKTLEK